MGLTADESIERATLVVTWRQEGRTYREIGERLGVSAPVAWQIFNAYAKRMPPAAPPEPVAPAIPDAPPAPYATTRSRRKADGVRCLFVHHGLLVRPSQNLPHTKYSIPTGHPPVAVQIAQQVRSGSGMTWGERSPDGARIPPGFTSKGTR